jgi:hypothetical protein
MLTWKTPASALSIADSVCAAGAQCAAVQGAPTAKLALADLQAAVTTAHGQLALKLEMESGLKTATAALLLGMQDVREKLAVYETTIVTVADGNSATIAEAGCDPRPLKKPRAALERVVTAATQPGKQAKQAILSWPAAPGAAMYVVSLNFTTQDPTGPWTDLTAVTMLHRVVEGPTPGGQFLARVAAVSSDGVMADWSDMVLVTAA